MRLVDTIKNIWKIEDLRKRILITILYVVIYRLGSFVVLPGVNPDTLTSLASQTSEGLMALLNMFSGGAFSNASIFALGIMPYISASIVMQLAAIIIPSMQKMQREGTTQDQSMDTLPDGADPIDSGSCLSVESRHAATRCWSVATFGLHVSCICYRHTSCGQYVCPLAR